MPLATFAEFKGTEEAYEKYLFLNADRESLALYYEFVRGRGVEFLVSGCASCLGRSGRYAGCGGRSGLPLCGESVGSDGRERSNRVEAGSGGGDASGWKVEGEVRVEREDVSDDGLVRDDGFGVVGSASENRGKHWRKNQRKSANRKIRNRTREVNADAGLRGVGRRFEGVGYSEEVNADAGPRSDDRRFGDEKSFLRKSLEEKWCAENELRVAKARRELELIKAEDLDAVKKLRERKVQGATERTMVQIEKAHASLVQTGNVPGVQPVQQGFCQTVVDGEIVESVPGLSSGESKECSISPSSSISEREVRNMMKELEDLREENKRYRRKEGLGERVSRMYNESVPVTLDDEGCVPEDIKELAADRFEGHGFFKYGKVFEKDGKKYKTMKFDAEGYSYSGIENWYD